LFAGDCSVIECRLVCHFVSPTTERAAAADSFEDALTNSSADPFGMEFLLRPA